MTDDFIKAFYDFHKECNDASEELEKLLYLYYEQQAAELELPTDYYIQEFVLN